MSNDLELYDKNPRYISEPELQQLKQNLKELGDLAGIVHDINSGAIIGGNQRSKAIDINQCDIVITEEYKEPTQTGTIAYGHVIWEGEKFAYRKVKWNEEQRRKANITANKLGGHWDWDLLPDIYSADELKEYGFTDLELYGDGADPSNGDDNSDDKQSIYTTNIEAPHYQPTGERPEIAELYNKEKYEELLSQISKSNLSEEEKTFLQYAACRHVVFRYDKIAEYYAHASKELQELMENSALVIIDFNKAIENGFVKLTDDLKEQFANEEADNE